MFCVRFFVCFAFGFFFRQSEVYTIYGCLAETTSRESSGLKPAFSLPEGHLCSPRDVSVLGGDDF